MISFMYSHGLGNVRFRPLCAALARRCPLRNLSAAALILQIRWPRRHWDWVENDAEHTIDAKIPGEQTTLAGEPEEDACAVKT